MCHLYSSQHNGLVTHVHHFSTGCHITSNDAGLTRARELLVVVAARATLHTALGRAGNEQRMSALHSRIASAVSPSPPSPLHATSASDPAVAAPLQSQELKQAPAREPQLQHRAEMPALMRVGKRLTVVHPGQHFPDDKFSEHAEVRPQGVRCSTGGYSADGRDGKNRQHSLTSRDNKDQAALHEPQPHLQASYIEDASSTAQELCVA